MKRGRHGASEWRQVEATFQDAGVGRSAWILFAGRTGRKDRYRSVQEDRQNGGLSLLVEERCH